MIESSTRTAAVGIKPGTFRMGADPGPDVMRKMVRDDHTKPDWDEAPPHQVTLTRPFSIASTPVTQAEFALFSPSYKRTLEKFGIAWNPQAPATMVTWEQAAEFSCWLADATGEPWRLPTEAEWEYAAHNANAHGLHGMGKDLSEWCRDWWAPYPGMDRTDPTGPESGTVRVIRGGRPTNRAGSIPGDRRADLGFRLVRAPEPVGDITPATPPAQVFLDVSQKNCPWQNLEVSEPRFDAPIPFIEPPADMRKLPYWERQHVPSVTWCPNGDLLATVFSAPKDSSNQMAILLARLRHGAKCWDPPTRFFIAPDRNIGSAALFTDAEGVIHHYNGLGGSDCHDFSLLRRISTDNGVTWSEFEIAREHDFGYRGAHMDPFVLQDGMLAMPTDGEKFCGTVLYVSSDNGKTWTERTGQNAFRQSAILGNSDPSLASNPFDSVTLKQGKAQWNVEELAREDRIGHWMAGIHAQPVEVSEGRLLAIGRGDNLDGYAPLSLSPDGGKTWTYSPSPFRPIGSGQRATMRRLAEGPILHLSFFGPYQETIQKGIRFKDAAEPEQVGLFAALSFDEGKTWPHRKELAWDGERRFPTEEQGWPSEFGGYLSCVQSPDGWIHMVSSYRYYRFNLAWLTA